jgi:hypothetical protein
VAGQRCCWPLNADPLDGTSEMENAETLRLVAELAIGVLGFSGVVAVLGRRGAGEWAPIDRFRFLIMVHTAALVLALAVLPFPFHSAGFVGGAIWGWCSGVAVTLLVFMFVAGRAVDPAPKGAFTAPGVSRIARAYAVPAPFVALCVFGMNAIGIGLARSATPYLVGVLLLLGVTVVLFIRLLHTAMGPRRAV